MPVATLTSKAVIGKAGVQSSQYFKDLMDAQTSASGVIGVLNAVRPYIESYSEMGDFTPPRLGGQNGGGKSPSTTPPPGPRAKAAQSQKTPGKKIDLSQFDRK